VGIPRLIYCADGNPRFAKIALDAGFEYGARLPGSIGYPIVFADQDWKDPNRETYMSALSKHQPEIATVLDWERQEQRDEVLGWAEEAAQYVQKVVIIPKVIGGIESLPRKVGGADIVLGYSVPTRYGGTFVPVWEFAGWPVHLLGGSPQAQMKLRYYLDVVSADGNYANKMATRYCQFWIPGTARYAINRYWPTLREANGGENWPGEDAPYEAFRRSCENIMAAWRQLSR
jgi:hypothetical protein